MLWDDICMQKQPKKNKKGDYILWQLWNQTILVFALFQAET